MVRRGHAEYLSNHSREFEPFALAVRETFTFLPNWHQTESSNPLVRQYQAALDAMLVTHSHMATCVAICRHCGIRFLSHPRNVNRQDLLCPFGCRDHLRRQASRERSRKFRQSDSARRKKKLLNAKRSLRVVAGAPGVQTQPDHSVVSMNPAADVPSPMDVLPCDTCNQPCNQPYRQTLHAVLS